MRKFDITLSFNSVALTFSVNEKGVISLFGDNIAVFEKYTSNSFRIMLANGEDFYGSTKQVVFNRALGSLLDDSSNGDYVEIEEATKEVEQDATDTISKRTQKAVEKFNEDLKAFAEETEEVEATLYEDINTPFTLSNVRLENGCLCYDYDGREEVEHVVRYDEEAGEYWCNEDEIKDFLKFWRSCLRRAKKYWLTDSETLDNMHKAYLNGEVSEASEDIEHEVENDQEAEKEETPDNSTYISIEGIETRRKLANICLKAFNKITGSNNGTIREPYELASSVLRDGRTLIQTIYEDGEVIYNDGYYVVELTDNILYIDITVKAAKELKKSESAKQVTTGSEISETSSFPCVPVSIAKESDYRYAGTDTKKRTMQIKAISEAEGITAKDAVKNWPLTNF